MTRALLPLPFHCALTGLPLRIDQDLSGLNSTGSYFIVSAADSLVALDMPAFTYAGGNIANRAVSIDGPWAALESISFPVLETAEGNVYMRPNEGLTQYAVELSSFDGPVCLRGLGLTIGAGPTCNFPASSSARTDRCRRPVNPAVPHCFAQSNEASLMSRDVLNANLRARPGAAKQPRRQCLRTESTESTAH